MYGKFVIEYSEDSRKFNVDEISNSSLDASLKGKVESLFHRLSQNEDYYSLTKSKPTICFLVVAILLFCIILVLSVTAIALKVKGEQMITEGLEYYYAGNSYILNNSTFYNISCAMKNTDNFTNMTIYLPNCSMPMPTSNFTYNQSLMPPSMNQTVNMSFKNQSNLTINMGGILTLNQNGNLMINQRVVTNSSNQSNITNYMNTTGTDFNDWMIMMYYMKMYLSLNSDGLYNKYTANRLGFAVLGVSIALLILIAVFVFYDLKKKKLYSGIKVNEAQAIEEFKETVGTLVNLNAQHYKQKILCCNCFCIINFQYYVDFKEGKGEEQGLHMNLNQTSDGLEKPNEIGFNTNVDGKNPIYFLDRHAMTKMV